MEMESFYSEKTMEDLPAEMLNILFSYLTLEDRKVVRLVSKSWRNICDSVGLAKNDTIVIRRNMDLDQLPFNSSSLNIRIEDIARRLPHLAFWQERGPLIKSLEIFKVNLRCAVLYDILSYCPNLESLALTNFDINGDCQKQNTRLVDADVIASSCSNLRNLKSLELLLDPLMAADDICLLTKDVSNLKYLSFGTLPNNSIVEAVASLIVKHGRTLKELHFVNCKLFSQLLFGVVLEKLGPQLVSLSVPYMPGSGDHWLPIIAKKFKNLEKLQFSISRNRNSDPNLDVCPLLPLKNLKFVSVSGADISDNFLFTLVGLEKLEGLDLSGCFKLTANGILTAFKQKSLPNLEILRLSGVEINNKMLGRLGCQLPNLKFIYLDNCCDITNRGVFAIVRNCKLLRHVSFDDCRIMISSELPRDVRPRNIPVLPLLTNRKWPKNSTAWMEAKLTIEKEGGECFGAQYWMRATSLIP